MTASNFGEAMFKYVPQTESDDPQQIFDKINEAFEPVKLEYKFLDREKSLTTIESKNKQ